MHIILSNKYGRLLLDDDDKKMAQFTGASFLLALVAGMVYFSTDIEQFLILAIVFGLLMIPLGTFLKPHRPKIEKLQVITRWHLLLLDCSERFLIWILYWASLSSVFLPINGLSMES